MCTRIGAFGASGVSSVRFTVMSAEQNSFGFCSALHMLLLKMIVVGAQEHVKGVSVLFLPGRKKKSFLERRGTAVVRTLHLKPLK